MRTTVSAGRQSVLLLGAASRRSARRALPALAARGFASAASEAVAMPPVETAHVTAPPPAPAKVQESHAVPRIISPKELAVSFEEFPYHLSEPLKQALISTSYVRLHAAATQAFLPRLRGLTAGSILLHTPPDTELFAEALAHALAKHHGVQLAVFDHDEHLETYEVEEEEEAKKAEPARKPPRLSGTRSRSGPEPARIQKLEDVRNKLLKQFQASVVHVTPAGVHVGPDGRPIGQQQQQTEAPERSFVEGMGGFLSRVQNAGPCIVYMKEIDTVLDTEERRKFFLQRWRTIKAAVLITTRPLPEPEAKRGPQQQGFLRELLGQSEEEAGPESEDFPIQFRIVPPTDTAQLAKWKEQLAADRPVYRRRVNEMRIRRVLKQNGLMVPNTEANDVLSRKILPEEDIDQLVTWAVSHSVQQRDKEQKPSADFIVSAQGEVQRVRLEPGSVNVLDWRDIKFGINIMDGFANSEKKDLKDIEPDNQHEEQLMSEIVSPHDIDIKFDDIGALENVKTVLRELVMYPLQYPGLFRPGHLVSRPSGILLFGPPGTGKTMLAQAVAKESGARFLNISMAALGSKWFGESENLARAVFSLARKLSPCVVFIDEIDSALGQRGTGEHEATRKVKNELLSSWDGLKSRASERVIVLGASNRPFDLDDAVLRRMPRRLLVDLPDKAAREKILKLILKREVLDPSFDMQELSEMTEGYSGSDLRNLAMWAAYQPIREFVNARHAATGEAPPTALPPLGATDSLALRAIALQDFKEGVRSITPTAVGDTPALNALRKWNEKFGEGGGGLKKSVYGF